MKAYKRRAEARYYLGDYEGVGPDADAALRLDPSQRDLQKFKVGTGYQGIGCCGGQHVLRCFAC